MDRVGTRPMLAGAILALVATVFVAYSGTLDAPFVYDDINALRDNPHIRRLMPLHVPLTAPPGEVFAGRPLPSLSFALNHAFTGFNLRSWHVTNLLFHAANAALIFLLLRRLLPDRPARSALAFAASLVWAVHPISSEAVIYLTQRTELMVTFFYLLTLLTASNGLGPSAAADPREGRGWRASCVIACLLGMASKEVMVSAPLAVLLIDATLRASGSTRSLPGRALDAVRERRVFYACLASTWLLLAFLIVTSPRGISAGFGRGIGAIEYLLTQAGVLVHYLRLCFWPTPLLIFHDWPLAVGFADVWWQFLLLAVLFSCCLVGLWRGRVWGVAGIVAFMVLAPSSSFVPVVTEVVAERRMYLASAVVVTLIFAGLAWVVDRLAVRLPRSEGVAVRGGVVALAAAITVASVFTFMTHDRGRDWSTAEVNWRQAAAWGPEHPQTLTAIGVESLKAGRMEEAATQFTFAARSVLSGRWRMYQRLTEPIENLARIRMRQQRYAEAAVWLGTAAELRPGRAQFRHDLAVALSSGQADPASLTAAERAMERAIALAGPEAYPGAPKLPPEQVAEWRVERALILQRLGRLPDAIAEAEAAAQMSPGSWRPPALLGRLLASQQRLGEAAAQYERALRLNPQSVPLRDELLALRARMHAESK